MSARRHHRSLATNSIDEMEKLLGQLGDFENQIKNPESFNNPAFQQEYTLFTQYLKWRLEDLNQAIREEMNIHIKGLN
jgi:hypothetical protein